MIPPMSEEKLGKKSIIVPIIGWIIGIIALLISKPWTPALGPSYSPARMGIVAIFSVTACLSFAWYWCAKWATRPEWVAPPGRYVPGAKPKVWSTYTYAGIGIVAALFIAASAAGAPMKVDLAGLVVAACAPYFGPVITAIGMYIGEVLAYGPLALSVAWGVSPSPEALAYAILDASIWAYAGYVIFWIRDTRIYKKSSLLGILAAMALIEPVHYGFWYIYYFIDNPWEAFVPLAWVNLVTWVAWAPILVFIGMTAGDSLYRSRILAAAPTSEKR